MADHGYSKYTNEKCRCDVCRRANAEHVAQRRRERVAITAQKGVPEGVVHGANAYLNWGCRCAICRGARSEADRTRYLAKKAEASSAA